MKKWIIIATTLTLVLGLLGSGYLLLSLLGASGPGEDDLVEQAAVDVAGESVEVELGTVSSLLVLDATVRPEPGEELKARQGGTVTHVWLDNGATVENGAPIINVAIPADGSAEGPAQGSEGSGGDASGEGSEGGSDAPATSEVTLSAPADGKISGMGDVEVGDVLEPGATVATVAPEEFRAVAPIPANDLYRFYDDPGDIMLKVDKGPPAAECEFISLGAPEDGAAPEAPPEDDPADSDLPPEEGGNGSGAGSGSELACRVPADLRVFDGVQGKLSVSTGEAENVVAVPVTAVRGTSEEGEVIVVGDDGAEETREVTLGLSDGEMVEVEDGLSVGETIVDPVPLDPRFDVPGADDDEEDDEFFGMGD